MPNNCNQQSILRQCFTRFASAFAQAKQQKDEPSIFLILADIVIVARVQPRTSKGITDLFLPITSNTFSVFVLYRRTLTTSSASGAECLPGLLLATQQVPPSPFYAHTSASYYTTKVSFVNGITGQLTPPTKNGHAPPPNES